MGQVETMFLLGSMPAFQSQYGGPQKKLHRLESDERPKVRQLSTTMCLSDDRTHLPSKTILVQTR